jgi:hypothetical protein
VRGLAAALRGAGVTRARRIVLRVAVIAACALVAAWLFSNLEWRERKITNRVGPEARLNPLLACERLLTRLGLPSESRTSVEPSPPPEHVLILRSDGSTFTARKLQRLLDWVAQGGYLIVVQPGDAAARRAFVELGDEEGYAPILGDEFGVTCKRTHDSGLNESIDLGAGPLDVDFGGFLALELDDPWSFDPPALVLEDHVVSLQHGAGRITWVASDRWLVNDEIGEADHAELVWQLVRLGAPRQGARIVARDSAGSLFATLFGPLWRVGSALLVALVLWVWSRSRRFGPVLPDPPAARRDFNEHVEAAGEFLWRHGGASLLLDAQRRELKRRIHTVRPDLADAAPAKLARGLAELVDADEREIRVALVAPPGTDPTHYTRVTRQLTTLRKAL